MGAITAVLGMVEARAAGEAVVRRAGISYGPNPRHRLDVYVPRRAAGAAPVVVFFYGGSWQGGHRADYRFVGTALAAQGFVVVVPDYRVWPEVGFPAFLQDGAQALGWAHAHAAQFGGDARRMVLMGHSAGAHIAAMLAFERRWMTEAGINPSAVRALVGLAGPYDFLPLHDAALKALFGPPAELAATQPINFVDARSPPALLAAGARDRSVSPGNVTRLAARMRATGGDPRVAIYPGVGHRLILGALSRPLRPLAPVLADVSGFVREVTAADAASLREPAA